MKNHESQATNKSNRWSSPATVDGQHPQAPNESEERLYLKSNPKPIPTQPKKEK